MLTFRQTTVAAVSAAVILAGSACGSGFDDGSSSQQSEGPAELTVLIASSGDAETKAVTEAAEAWAKESGSTVKITVAQDIAQELGQGFASDNPPDVFYVDAARFADYASVGALEPYADGFPEIDDFYPALRESFTLDGKQYCVPKDFSTLGLVINTDLWAAAGLTEADYPKTWDDLAAVAKKLTTGTQVGLALGDTRDRIGAFMVESGGWVLDADGKTVTADSPENLAALQYVQKLLADGVAKFPKQLDSGWGGEAFGKGAAAMTIEGNWIKGAMKNDYPTLKYTVVELPEGPAGKGTLSFTQCWGIAAKSEFQSQAQDLVAALTAPDQQLAFADAFGVMPSRESVREQYTEKFPEDAAFLSGADYAQGPVNAPKVDPVLADFDTGLQGLPAGDPKQILSQLQANAEAAIAD